MRGILEGVYEDRTLRTTTELSEVSWSAVKDWNLDEKTGLCRVSWSAVVEIELREGRAVRLYIS